MTFWRRKLFWDESTMVLTGPQPPSFGPFPIEYKENVPKIGLGSCIPERTFAYLIQFCEWRPLEWGYKSKPKSLLLGLNIFICSYLNNKVNFNSDICIFCFHRGVSLTKLIWNHLGPYNCEHGNGPELGQGSCGPVQTKVLSSQFCVWRPSELLF